MKNIFTKSDKFNPNYASKVIEVDNIRDHPNADRLSIITVNGENIIVTRDSVKVGELMIFCACESALNTDFLRLNNQFRDKELNSNIEDSGFFEKTGRVKAIKIRGEISTGFLFPLPWLQTWQPELNLDDIIKNIRYEKLNLAGGFGFDEVNGVLFSKKYVISTRQTNYGTTKNNKRNNRLKRFDKLIENQFNFHYDTSKLADNLHKIDPDDVVSITTKYHGSSVITSYILTNKELKWYERLLLKFGVDVKTTQYDYIYSSRGVVKNRYVNKDVGQGYYSTDIWTYAGEVLKPFLHKGQTIYAELCGYEPGTKKFIQKDHDYKNKEGEMSIHIYRITTTNEDGFVREWSAKQVQNWCNLMGLPAVKELYYGCAKDIFPEISTAEHWHRNLLDALSKDKNRFFMECNSPDCNNAVPHEGLVIRNESKEQPAFKLKTKAHFLRETADLDSGEIDIETAETEENES